MWRGIFAFAFGVVSAFSARSEEGMSADRCGKARESVASTMASIDSVIPSIPSGVSKWFRDSMGASILSPDVRSALTSHPLFRAFAVREALNEVRQNRQFLWEKHGLHEIAVVAVSNVDAGHKLSAILDEFKSDDSVNKRGYIKNHVGFDLTASRVSGEIYVDSVCAILATKKK